MSAEEMLQELVWESYNEYDRTKTQTEILDLHNVPEGITPLGSFIAALTDLYEEAGDDKKHMFLRASELGDSWYKGISIVMQKDKSPEELEEIRQQQLRAKAAEAGRERRLYEQLKAKFES